MKSRTCKSSIILLLAMFCLGTNVLHAQYKYERAIEKRSIVIGISAGADYTTATNGSLFNLYFIPSFGYFIFNRFYVGANIGAQIQFFNQNNLNETIAAFSAGPELRYYIGKRKFIFYPFLGGSYVFGQNRIDTSIVSNALYGTAGIGVPFFIRNNTTLNVKLGYRFGAFYQDDPMPTLHSHQIYLAFSLEFYLFRKDE